MDTDRHVEIQGARIRYRSEGAGPPAILIHGIGASLEYWRWTTPALRDRFTVIALDYPGFGLSDPVPGAETPEGSAAVMLGFMDALGIRRAALIGSSLGGGIATLAAGAAPERCAALVVVAPGGFGPGLGRMMRWATLRGVGEVVMALVRVYPRLGIRDAFADPRRIPPEVVEIARRDVARPGAARIFLRTLRASATRRGVRPEMVARVHAAASRISAPTLVVWGDRDRVIPPDQAAVAARAIPGARLQMMHEVGHVPYIEAPEAFNAIVTAFLDEVSRPVSAVAEAVP